MRSTLLLLAASTVSVAKAGVASQSSKTTANWAWPSAETHATSTTLTGASVGPTSTVAKDASEASLSMAVESAYSASLAATMAYTSTRNASTATSTLSPSATPTESFTRAAPMQQCIGRLDGELPAYTPPGYTFSGKIRRYYISAEPITWNYMPTGWDNWLGVPLEDSPRVYRAGYTEAAGSLGLLWEKAVYRGYTDATFSNYTETADWMGINGPIVRAEVGDMIEILFVNNLKSHFASIHSMGLSYNKDNEGSLYPNNTTPGMTSGSQNADIYSTPNTTQSVGNAVPPGGCFTYKWVVSNSSAPTGSALTKFWAYHPYVNMQSDMDAGLVGPCIIYAPGTMDSVVASTREFILLYMNFNEQNSWMAETNANAYGLTNLDAPSGPMPALGRGYGNASVWQPQIINMPSVSLSSTQAPSFHSLNGYSYSNCPRFEMCVDDPVIWYVYAFGMASHVFHLHGNNYYFNGEEHASISFNDGVMRALPMNASSPGEWNLICHVSNHQVDGMVDNYVVKPNQGPNGTCGLPPLATLLPFQQ